MTTDKARLVARELSERMLAGKSDGANETVAVAMSGGVDSSVTAALMSNCGYKVIGMTMRVWSAPAEDQENCCVRRTEIAVEAARQVAGELGIPHCVVDLQDEFREIVVNEFCKEYLRARTPNPCVICNSRIKFGVLMRHARQLGADWLATGHYARVKYDSGSGRYLLLKGVDARRDQSYVLYRLTQAQLSRAIFPLGYYEKREVRALAKDLGLSVADRSESREICFIPDDDYRRFLRRYACALADADEAACSGGRCSRKGNIVTIDGDVLGTHQGIENYTVGQRKGLGIASARRKYVVGIDPETCSVVVGDEADLYSSELVASNCNWISIEKPWDCMKASAKIRYSFQPVDVTVFTNPDDETRVRIVFDEPVRAVTPGQAVVLYDGDVVLGGGTIEKAIRVAGAEKSLKGAAQTASKHHP